MVKTGKSCFLAALVALAAVLPGFAQAAEPVTIAISDNYPPFSVIGPLGEPRGVLVDMWRAWSKATGTPVKFRASTWADTLKAVRDGEADIHSGLFKNPQREEYLDFSEAIHEVKTGVFFKAGSELVPLSQLSGEKVGTIEGTYQQRYIKENLSGLNVVGYPSGEDLTLALLKGEIRAAVSEVPTIQSNLARHGLQGTFERHPNIVFSNQTFAAVKKGRHDLLEKINEGFRAVLPTTLARIERLWFPDVSDHYYAGADGRLTFTTAEEAWLASNPIIRLAVTDFITPVDIVDAQGNYTGLNADLIAILNNKLGINITPEFFSKWGDVANNATSGQVDGAFSLSRTPEREKTILFTKPYAFDPVIVLVRETDKGISAFEDLSGKIVSVVKGAATIATIRKVLGNGKLVEVEDEITGLKGLAAGQFNAHVSWLLPYGNAVRAEPVPGLRIAVKRNSEGGTLRIGIHKSRPELYDIIRKGLNAITREELAEIRNRWLFPKPKENRSRVSLTEVENAWLTDHPVIRIGMMTDWPPFSYLNDNGLPQGISAAITDALNQRLGGLLHLVPGPWKQHLKDLEEGRLDALFDLTPNKAREKIYNFTNPYLTVPHVIVAGKDTLDISSEEGLQGKTLALERGFGNVKYFRNNYPEVKVVEFADTREALDAVVRGKADAYAGNRAVAAYIMEREVMHNIKMHGRLIKKGSVLAIGTRKDWPPLAGILQKALVDIGNDEFQAIVRKWVSGSEEAPQNRIKLTEAEKTWLKTHKSVRVMVGTWPPFQYVEDGEAKGLAIETVTKILEGQGLEVVPVAILWADALVGINRFEKVDLLPTIARSAEREKMVNITEDYISFPSVIVNRTKVGFVTSLKDLYGKTVAVEKNFIDHKRLARDHPQITLMPVKTTKEAMTAVSLSKADAYVGNLAVATFLIDKLGLVNLKIAAQTDYANNNQAIGVRRDWPELASIIDKALAVMTDEERQQIRQKAFASQIEYGIDVKEVLIWGGGIGAFVIFFFTLVIGWNRSQGKEIAERKKIEMELAEKETQMRNALEGMSGGLVMADKNLIIRVINDKMVDWYDLPKDVGQPGAPLRGILKFRAERGDYGPGDPEELTTQRLEDYMDGTVMRSEDHMPDGRTLELIRSPADDGGAVIVCNDITEQKKAEVELAEKEAQVATALASMSGGLFMIDKEFNIKVVNEKIIEWYDLPDGVGRPGTPLRDFLSVRANRGEYGPGEPEELIEQRLKGYRDRSIQRVEDHVPGDRILEVLRAPTDDGGMVVVCNDITESKHAEDKMRDNLGELEKFSSLAVGRELRMIDLKQEINDLLKTLGKEPEYEIVE